jgi:hypothetical protein
MGRAQSLIAALACLAASLAQAQVQKCVLPSGKTVYQDSPCETGTSRPVVVVPTSMGGVNGASGSVTDKGAQADEGVAAYLEVRRQHDEADSKKQCLKLSEPASSKCLEALPNPKIGMTAKVAIDSRWGSPELVQTSETAAGKFDTWLYSDGSTLTLKDGVVVRIDKTTGPPSR